MGSLDGLKILDFSTLLPGPYATLMLADMGAEVLKISSPGKFDLVQDYGARIEGTVCPENVGRVKKEIRDIFRTKTQEEWISIFSEVDACVQPVLDLKEALLEDEQIQARDMVVEVDLPLHEGVKVKQMGTAIRMSETPCEYRYAGFPLGYHTREIVDGLGLDYESLSKKGVFD